MLCYMDMTFCTYYKNCAHHLGGACHRGLTPEVMRAAERWWKSPEAPICQYAQKPNCYEFKSPLKGGKS